MSGHTYGGVTLNFTVSKHHNLNVGHAPNKHSTRISQESPKPQRQLNFIMRPSPAAMDKVFAFVAFVLSLGGSASAITDNLCGII